LKQDQRKDITTEIGIYYEGNQTEMVWSRLANGQW